MECSATRRSSSSGKPSFSLTCSRLSQYLKENGSFGDLSLGMSCKPETNGKEPSQSSACIGFEEFALHSRATDGRHGFGGVGNIGDAGDRREREEGEILETPEETSKEVSAEVSEGDSEEETGTNEHLNMNIGKAGKTEKGERPPRPTISRLSKTHIKSSKKLAALSAKEGFPSAAGMSRKPTTTMSLFPCEASNVGSMAAAQDVKPKNLFPRQPSFSSSSSSIPKEVVPKMTQTTTTRSLKPEPQTAPLTIFYGGQVIVFNDFSAEKAKEVMNLASKGTANTFTGFKSTLNNNIAPTPNQVPHLMKTASQDPKQTSSAAMACELPIARRASLHRFLAKRKDRVTSKAPYQLSDPAKAFSKPQTGNSTTSWLAAECIAVSVDYRRAPEHPIPIPYGDSWDALKWVFTHVSGSGPERWVNDHADFSRVFLAGDSAGANIAHHMAMRAGKEKKGSFEISGMALFHPFFFSKAPVEEEHEAAAAMRYMQGMWEIASPNSEMGVEEDPWVNVVGSDMSGLGCGRVLVMVAGNDVLAREGWGYAAKLEKSSGWEGRVGVIETEDEDHIFHIKNPDSINTRLLVQSFAEFLKEGTSCI
ncbi:hypothetical protein YC2023_070572 [Brassica napus]